MEEGAWTRRPGTLFGAITRNGLPAVVRNFDFTLSSPYTLEFTAGHMRMFASTPAGGIGLVLTDQHTVVNVSTATPAVMQTGEVTDYASADQVQFNVTAIPGASPSVIAPLLGRQFALVKIDTTHFSLFDTVTGTPINGATLNTNGWAITVAKVLDRTVPYTQSQLQAIRLVQDDTLALLLHGSYKPRQVQNVAVANQLGYAELAFSTVTMFDGPYLDPPVDASTLTPSTTGSSTVVLTASAITSINSGLGFQATDVGRMVRLFCEPLNWAAGTAYTTGQLVKYAGVYWQALANSTGKQPDTNAPLWAVTTTAAAWTWGNITVVTDTTHVTVLLAAADPAGVNAGGNCLYTNPVVTWQLGVYSDTTGWPTGGTYHEGRFWLFSQIKNRFDATMADNGGIPEGQGLQFAPTAIDGTVSDANGISALLKATDLNSIFWMEPDHQGIICGTQAGEWLVSASNLNDPLTPFSVQAHRVTKYGCANVLPARTGLSMTFVQRYARKLYEYIADVYSGKFSGTNLAINAQHLSSPCSTIAEIAYVVERVPIVWMRMGDGSLKGMTYKRESPFGTQPASFFAWHEHPLGSGRNVESLQSGPLPGGETDTLVAVTNDPATGVRYVEFLSPVFDENQSIQEAQFVDAAVTPSSAEIVGGVTLRMWGLNYVAGKTVTAFVNGIDGGDAVVQSDGHVDFPLPSANGLLTLSNLAAASFNACGGTNLNLQIQVTPPGTGYTSPNGAASVYTSSTVAGAHFARGNFDWDNGLLYQEQVPASGADPSTNNHTMFVFNIATRAQVAGPLDPGELAFATGPGGGATGPSCMGFDHHIYYGTSDATHLVGRFNTTSHLNDVNYNDSHGLGAVGYVAPIQLGSTELILTTGLNSGVLGSTVNVIQMTNTTALVPTWTGATFTVDEAPGGGVQPGNAYPCRGLNGSGFVLAVGGEFGVGTVQIGVYRVSVIGPATDGSQVGMTKLGVITPTQVQAGWTSVILPIGGNVIYDETDGNLIALVQGSDSTFRLIKINATTAAVMWKATVTASVDFHTSRVRGGSFSYIDGTSMPWTLKQFNTLTGALITNPTEASIGPSLYSTDDRLGQLVINTNDIGATDWATFGPSTAPGAGTITPAVVYSSAAAVGFNYVSRGQMLRAISPQESGARNGPALGKTRRTHMIAAQLAQTQGIYFGSVFDNAQLPTRIAPLTTYPGSTAVLPLNQLYAGVLWMPIEDPYGFDGMVAWEIKRPYPATVLAIEAFLHTQDR